jgi:hypothetical protein
VASVEAIPLHTRTNSREVQLRALIAELEACRRMLLEEVDALPLAQVARRAGAGRV